MGQIPRRAEKKANPIVTWSAGHPDFWPSAILGANLGEANSGKVDIMFMLFFICFASWALEGYIVPYECLVYILPPNFSSNNSTAYRLSLASTWRRVVLVGLPARGLLTNHCRTSLSKFVKKKSVTWSVPRWLRTKLTHCSSDIILAGIKSLNIFLRANPVFVRNTCSNSWTK